MPTMKATKVATRQELNNEIAKDLLKNVDAAIEALNNYERRMLTENLSTAYDAELILKCRMLRGRSEHMQYQLSQIRQNAKHK